MAVGKWPYNSRVWRRLRLMVLRDDPFCRYCRQAGKYTPATVADHIIPVKLRPDLAYDIDNLQPLCEHCHNSIKHRMERGRTVGADIDGNPVGGWKW